jgi:hypothetical protein
MRWATSGLRGRRQHAIDDEPVTRQAYLTGRFYMRTKCAREVTFGVGYPVQITVEPRPETPLCPDCERRFTRAAS